MAHKENNLVGPKSGENQKQNLVKTEKSVLERYRAKAIKKIFTDLVKLVV